MANEPLKTTEQPADQPRPGLAGVVFDSHEAIFTGEYVTLTADQARARKRRGQWIALGLFTFCIVIFLVTMTRMGQNLMVGGS